MPSCPRCAATVPAGARFCPRCGQTSLATGPEADAPRHGTAGGIPWAGILFVLGILFAPAAVISGLYWESNALVWSGVVAAAILLLVVLLGTLL